MNKQPPKNRNFVAASLRSPHLKPQVVPDKKKQLSKKMCRKSKKDIDT